MKRTISLTDSELTYLIRKVVTESQLEPEVEEGWLGDKLRDASRGVRKLTTGKPTHPREYFIDDILDIEDEIETNPDDFIYEPNEWEKIKMTLIAKASDSDYSGKLVKKETNNGKYKVIYEK
ncbi:MAG: hypothetical protein RLZ10_235 [Bacteroidota bacterium]|jgi:hypothetical protein